MTKKFLILVNSFFYGVGLSSIVFTPESEDPEEVNDELADECSEYEQKLNNTLIIPEEDVPELIKCVEEFTGNKLFTIEQICEKWNEVYGEDMKSEYGGFIDLLNK